MNRSWLARIGIALAVAFAWAGRPALAQDSPAPPDDEPASSPAPTGNWEFRVAPYLWVTDLKADVSYKDVSGTLDPHIKDLLKNVQIGIMGSADLYHKPSRLSFYTDLLFVRMKVEETAGPFQVSAGPFSVTKPGAQKQVGPFVVRTPQGPVRVGPFDVATGPVKVTVPRVEFPVGPFDIEQTLTQIALRASLGYRVLDYPLADLLGKESADDPRRIRTDLYGGGRFWWMKVELDVEYPPIETPGFSVSPELVAYPQIQLPSASFSGVTFGGEDIEEEVTSWWVDPVVGVRTLIDLHGPFSLFVDGNVGGFGIGSASQFSWEALGMLTWRFGEKWTAAAGWRALDVDRRVGDLEVDLLMHGPILGLIYRFR